mgnify:CR=1 FL=1
MTIYKVNLGEEEELGKRFNIQGFPVLMYLENGKIKAKEFGIKTPDELKANVKKYLE